MIAPRSRAIKIYRFNKRQSFQLLDKLVSPHLITSFLYLKHIRFQYILYYIKSISGYQSKLTMSAFIPLRVHSEYSIVDGILTIKALTNAVRDMGMQACALTDQCNLFGAVKF